MDRARTLLPVIVQNAGAIPVELHSHCTTGLAPLVYLEALKLGVATLHTAVPPLANGSSQPSVLNVARNARLMGHTTKIDEKIIRSVAERLTAIAKQEKLPIGAPLEYDYAQYIHQIPGGVISNLCFQLASLGLQHRLGEVLEESVQVRKDLGYPIMITPHSQFIVTQAAINVTTGERYKLVIDELILFAQGVYGEEDLGYAWMDQNLKDRLLGTQRAKELEELSARRRRDVTLKEIREKLGGAGVSDEELLLRLHHEGRPGDRRDARRRSAAPVFQDSNTPLVTLLAELGKRKKIRHVQVQRGGELLVIQNRSGA